MNTLLNQQVEETKENGVVTTEIYNSFCTKCNQPYDSSCEICNGTGSKMTELFTEIADTEKITAIHCKYGCNSLRLCKGRCAKTS